MAPAIPKDSLVLVTGINGYLGSHVGDQFLEAGYRVRGTTRDLKKAEGLKELWEKKYGQDRLELVVVKDMSHEGAFDEAVKGVAAVAHTASNMTFDPDPNKVIPEVLAGINGILKSAAAEPSVKRFVYTSSSTAATDPKPNKEFSITADLWNEETIKEAWAPPPYNEDRKWAVYGSSKTEAEKAVWKFVKDQKPHFVCNAVLPNCNFGKILVKGQPASTGDLALAVYKGQINEDIKAFPPQYFVDVQDTGRLHVAAVTDLEIENERIFAFAEPFIWNDVLKYLRKLRPGHEFPEDFADDKVRDRSKVQNERGAEILKTFGRSGWTELEESLKNLIESQDL